MSLTAKEKVQSLLTAANTATGKSAADLTEAVGDLIDGQGGGVDLLSYLKSLRFPNRTRLDTLLPESYTFNLQSATSLAYLFIQSTLPKYVVVNSPNVTEYTDMCYYQGNANVNCTITTIIGTAATNFSEFMRTGGCGTWIIDGSTENVRNFGHFLNGAIVKRIEGALNFSSQTTGLNVESFSAANLELITFVPSTIKVALSFYKCNKLNDVSLVSIANGLSPSSIGQSVTFHADVRTRVNALMGTVVDDTFTTDESGAVSLADFITTVKGWTLA